jgi:hypothetical protein
MGIDYLAQTAGRCPASLTAQSQEVTDDERACNGLRRGGQQDRRAFFLHHAPLPGFSGQTLFTLTFYLKLCIFA